VVVNARAPRYVLALQGILAAALLLGAIGPASAHAVLAKAEPPRRAVLARPPGQVRLWFNERLEPAFSTLSVLGTDGTPVTQQAANVTAGDPKLLQLMLPPLAPGIYTVRYRVLSVDGHTVQSSYTFTVKQP